MLPEWLFPVVSIVITTLGTVWMLALWISRQFSTTKTFVYDRMESLQRIISDKLEFHERQDTERFANLQNDLWTIKLRNAAIDGANMAKNNKEFEKD